MTDPRKVAIVMVLDRSGSMEVIKEDMEGGFESFVQTQRQAAADNDLDVRMTLVQFDTEYEQVFADVPVANVGKLRLQPRGGTALHDAIGRTINDVGARLAALPEDQRPGKVILGVITDGLENSSREFTAAMVKEAIERQQNVYNWMVTYIGANQDAILVGEQLGFHHDFAMTFAPGATRGTMNVVGQSMAVAYASPGAFSGYTEEDRETAMDEDQPEE